MEDNRNLPPKSGSAGSQDIDNDIDELLPAPTDHDQSEPDRIDGPMDTLLTVPDGDPYAADDATTREELEVDTSADDVDDIIDVSGEAEPDNQSEPASTGDFVLEIGGEPITWEAVDDQAAAEITDDEDYEPINRDSEFIGSSYRSDSGGEGVAEPTAGSAPSQSARAEQIETEIAHQCPACGAAIGKVPYCPQCGTDQFPHSRFSSILSPLLSWSRPVGIRAVLSVAALLVLLALLADSGANALVISAITMPIVLVVRIAMQVRHHSRVGLVQIGLMAFIGLIVGLPLAWFAARMVRRSWFDTGVLNFGAAGFGGNFAEAAGVAPFIVWLVVGILLPIVLILGIGAAPAALRMVLNTHPQESTGMLLSGAVAAGFTAASGIMFYRPLYEELAPRMTTSQWTLTIFGLAVIRPLVWILAGAMIGAVVWRYMRTASPASIMIPAIIACSVPLGFSVLSLAAGPAGHWAETIVGLSVAIVTVFFYHRFLPTAIRNDESNRSPQP